MHTINPRYTQACRRKLRIPADVLTYPTYQRRTLAQSAAKQLAPTPAVSIQRNGRRFYTVYAVCVVGVLVVASLSSVGV